MDDTPLKLSAFADEISPELDEQIRVCRQVGVTHMELRNVRGVNVLDFDTPLREEIRTKLRENGMGVVCIGSPIGKVKISDPGPPTSTASRRPSSWQSTSRPRTSASSATTRRRPAATCSRTATRCCGG